VHGRLAFSNGQVLYDFLYTLLPFFFLINAAYYTFGVLLCIIGPPFMTIYEVYL
jgi:hypothetical protein